MLRRSFGLLFPVRLAWGCRGDRCRVGDLQYLGEVRFFFPAFVWTWPMDSMGVSDGD